MNRIAIIGAGISGLSCAHFLKGMYDVTLFEKEEQPGGLIRCRNVNGNLFHICGGHIFNTKRRDVLDFFWNEAVHRDDFTMTQRNAVVAIDDDTYKGFIPYPIENHIYTFPPQIQKAILDDFLQLNRNDGIKPENFEDFLRSRFGNTLYDIYFEPYNKKVWRHDLKQIPLSWLEGKLPTPSIGEILLANINHEEEHQFVHSSFWYEKQGGSQLIADSLALGLDIRYKSDIKNINYHSRDMVWEICGKLFDKVIFCGNIKFLKDSVRGIDISTYVTEIDSLQYHGTTSVFCEIDRNPYSWIYQPSKNHASHRIICTGNFSLNNNSNTLPEGRITSTIEFTDRINLGDIIDNLTRMPFNPKYLDHQYNEFTYPIQNRDTRDMIKSLKSVLAEKSFYMVGRFADWEYYNMDVAMGAAMDLCKKI